MTYDPMNEAEKAYKRQCEQMRKEAIMWRGIADDRLEYIGSLEKAVCGLTILFVIAVLGTALIAKAVM